MFPIDQLLIIYEYIFHVIQLTRRKCSLIRRAYKSQKEVNIKTSTCVSREATVDNNNSSQSLHDHHAEENDDDDDDLFPQINFEQFDPNSTHFIPLQPFKNSLR